MSDVYEKFRNLPLEKREQALKLLRERKPSPPIKIQPIRSTKSSLSYVHDWTIPGNE